MTKPNPYAPAPVAPASQLDLSADWLPEALNRYRTEYEENNSVEFEDQTMRDQFIRFAEADDQEFRVTPVTNRAVSIRAVNPNKPMSLCRLPQVDADGMDEETLISFARRYPQGLLFVFHNAAEANHMIEWKDWSKSLPNYNIQFIGPCSVSFRAM